jgi:hypothetical protein
LSPKGVYNPRGGVALAIFTTIKLWLNVGTRKKTFEPKNIFHLKLEGGTSNTMTIKTNKEKLRG